MDTKLKVALIAAGLLLANSIRQSNIIRAYESSMRGFIEYKIDGKTMDAYVLPGKIAALRYGGRMIVCAEVPVADRQ